MEKRCGINSEFNYSDNNVSFTTSSKINEGIDLESLSKDNYYLFLKIAYSNSDIKYYPLVNASEHNNITYYTITKNNTNNKIDISFDKYNDISYMSIKVNKAEKLPDDVYDIAIDPGHGGLDTGAVVDDYTEANIALKCSLLLKSKLEEMGLKVFISRDENSSQKEDTANNMYDENGRINIINASKAKLAISIHLNSDTYNKEKGGVEVYAPTKCNLEFASLIAENIVKQANTYYSELKIYKKADGVYVQNFTNADIKAFEKNATKGKYEPYNITTSTPYNYLIRETGGICTNAFVDGRNKSYGTNKFYNSNIGIETYLVQLGYMAIENDLNNIINNYDSYMEAIKESIRLNYNL